MSTYAQVPYSPNLLQATCVGTTINTRNPACSNSPYVRLPTYFHTNTQINSATQKIPQVTFSPTYEIYPTKNRPLHTSSSPSNNYLTDFTKHEQPFGDKASWSQNASSGSIFHINTNATIRSTTKKPIPLSSDALSVYPKITLGSYAPRL